MVVRAALIVAIFALSQLNSNSAIAYFDSGNDLHNACSREGDFASGLCMGIVSGVFDAMQAMGYKCQTANVTRQQSRDVVVRHMINNPGDRHHPAVFIAMESIIKTFSCKPPK